MEKFSRTLRGYNPDEVNRYLDKVINQVEAIISENKKKDAKLNELSKLEQENEKLKSRLEQY